MSIKSLLTGALAATLALGSAAAWAQHYDKRGHVVVVEQGQRGHKDEQRSKGDKHHRHSDRSFHHDKRAQRAHERYHRREERAERRQERRESRWNDRHERRYHQDRAQYYHSARGPDFRRGHYLPSSIRSPQYVVSNYRHHRLSAPPRGHHWVQVGADYVLVAVATGIIAHIVLNH